MNEECCIKGCQKTAKARGMCSMHLERLRVYSDPTRSVKPGTRHGLVHDPIYRIWSGAKNRCSNHRNVSYKNYGARGIKVSDEFLNPIIFINYVKGLPGFNNREIECLTLDRIDNDKGYERDNLRWATKTVQSLNKNLSPRNTTGYNGVSFAPSYRGKKKYVAYVKKDGKHIHLGWFSNPEEANEAIIKFKENDKTILG